MVVEVEMVERRAGGSGGSVRGYGLRAYCWRVRKAVRKSCLRRLQIASSGMWRRDWMLGGVLVRGRVRSREE